jgi:hypothetical protein
VQKGCTAFLPKMHNSRAKSLIIRKPKQGYKRVSATDGPAPHGVPQTEKGPFVMMSLRSLIQAAAAPVLLTAMLGLVIGFATVGVAGAV